MTNAETPAPGRLEVPLLPEGFRYRVVEASSAFLRVQVLEVNMRTGTDGLYPDRVAMDYTTGPERMGGWEFMTSVERVETGLRIVGEDFMASWTATRETQEMTAMVGIYERTGVRLP